MTLASYITLYASDYGEVYIGRSPIPNNHPPSLRNPLKVKVPTPQDGWKTGDSEALQKKAKADMAEILKRTRRQIGKPEIVHVAPMPWPAIRQWL